MSPKRVCGEYRNVPVERNPFTSPVNDRLLVNSPKPKLPPYLFCSLLLLAQTDRTQEVGAKHVQRQGSKLSLGRYDNV